MRTVPSWLAHDIGAPQPKKEGAAVLGELDSDHSVKHAIKWLKEHAQHCAKGARGSTAYRVAASVKDIGLSAAMCQEVMVEHWNETHCSPPMEFEDLGASVEHAYTYGVKAIGINNPANDFEPVTEAEIGDVPKPSPRAKLFFELAKDCEPDLTSISLVDDWLDQGAMSVVYGPSNVGKTFVAMSGFAYAVASGTPWNGKKVIQGAVLYVAAEAGVSARKRVKAMRLHYGRDDFPFALVPCPIDLLRPAGDCKGIIDLVAEVEKATGCRMALIVIDTLSRALAGGNESASEDMGAFIQNVDRIRSQTRAHLMVIHHSGKNEAMGARGWSGLRAATDTEIEVTEGKIAGTKQRDMEQQEPVGFRLQDVKLGERNDGKAISSAVAIFGEVEDTGFDEADPRLNLSGANAMMFRALEIAIAEHGSLVGKDMCVNNRQWRESFLKLYTSEAEKTLQEGCNVVKMTAPSESLYAVNRTRIMKLHVIEKKQGDQWYIPMCYK